MVIDGSLALRSYDRPMSTIRREEVGVSDWLRVNDALVSSGWVWFKPAIWVMRAVRPLAPLAFVMVEGRGK